MKNYIYLLIVILFTSTPLFAEDKNSENQEQHPINRMVQSSGWFFSGGYMALDSEHAEEEFIGDDAFSISLGWEGHNDNLVYAVGISGLFLSDNDEFSQVVEDNFGDISTASSSAEAFGFFGEMGYSYAIQESNTAFELLGGFELLSAERSIANCSNCFSEDINLDSGLYIKPRFRFYNEGGFILSVAYQYYLSGDIEGGPSLRFSWHH